MATGHEDIMDLINTSDGAEEEQNVKTGRNDPSLAITGWLGCPFVTV